MTSTPSPHPVHLRARTDPAVLVVRHGITEWNQAQRWQGWTDIPLSPTGIAQAEAAAEVVRESGQRFFRVVASDLTRAWRTAEILTGWASPPLEVEKHEALRERNIGDWAGLTTPEIRAGWPGALDAWRAGQLERPPNGETESVVTARVNAVLADVCRQAAEVGGVALVVCHGGVIHSMDRHAGAEPHPVGNLCGRWFDWDGARVRPGERVDLLDGLHEHLGPTSSSGNAL